MQPKTSLLIAGDLLALLVVTIIGFATHGETSLGYLPRLAAAFLPLGGAWLVLAPWFGLFEAPMTTRSESLLRAAIAMLTAGPLAAVVRGLLLNAPILPVFAVVLSASSAVGITAWRSLYLLLRRRAAGAASA